MESAETISPPSCLRKLYAKACFAGGRGACDNDDSVIHRPSHYALEELVKVAPRHSDGDRPAMRAVFYLPGEDSVHKRFELLYVGIPPGLDGRLAGDGVQDLIVRGIGVGSLSSVQLFAYLLDGGGSVRRGYPRRDGADGVVPLAERLYLKAELREQLPFSSRTRRPRP